MSFMKPHEATAHDDYLLDYAEVIDLIDELKERLDLHRRKSKQKYMDRGYIGDVQHLKSAIADLLNAMQWLRP